MTLQLPDWAWAEGSLRSRWKRDLWSGPKREIIFPQQLFCCLWMQKKATNQDRVSFYVGSLDDDIDIKQSLMGYEYGNMLHTWFFPPIYSSSLLHFINICRLVNHLDCWSNVLMFFSLSLFSYSEVFVQLYAARGALVLKWECSDDCGALHVCNSSENVINIHTGECRETNVGRKLLFFSTDFVARLPRKLNS